MEKIVFLTIDSLNEFFKRVDFHLYSRLCKCVIILWKENHYVVKLALSISFCPLVKDKKIYGRLLITTDRLTEPSISQKREEQDKKRNCEKGWNKYV